MITQLHENQVGQIRLNSDLSEPFPIANGVKQGCNNNNNDILYSAGIRLKEGAHGAFAEHIIDKYI